MVRVFRFGIRQGIANSNGKRESRPCPCPPHSAPPLGSLRSNCVPGYAQPSQAQDRTLSAATTKWFRPPPGKHFHDLRPLQVWRTQSGRHHVPVMRTALFTKNPQLVHCLHLALATTASLTHLHGAMVHSDHRTYPRPPCARPPPTSGRMTVGRESPSQTRPCLHKGGVCGTRGYSVHTRAWGGVGHMQVSGPSCVALWFMMQQQSAFLGWRVSWCVCSSVVQSVCLSRYSLPPSGNTWLDREWAGGGARGH